MSLHILIIEDKTITALHIKQTVEDAECKVVAIVKNAKDAMQIAKENRIDLIISDINIEGDLDGIECCEMLQKEYSIPTIFLTAYRDANTLKRASTVEFVGYLVKPFRDDELQMMIELATYKYKLQEKIDRCIISNTYSYSFKTKELYHHSSKIDLTAKETSFINLLTKQANSTISYAIMEEKVWDKKQTTEGTRRQFVRRFKQKLPNLPLELIKGIGYKLNI